MVGCTVENELKGVWKEVVLAGFLGIFCHFLGGNDINQEHRIIGIPVEYQTWHFLNSLTSS